MSRTKSASGRVQVYLDPLTLRSLDQVVNQYPEIVSRSAAIRYAVRKLVETMTTPTPRARKTKA